jgi:hypothetical protein
MRLGGLGGGECDGCVLGERCVTSGWVARIAVVGGNPNVPRVAATASNVSVCVPALAHDA